METTVSYQEYLSMLKDLPKNVPPADIGVIVARFQTPDLTPAHKRIIFTALANHQKVLIVLGVAPILNSLRDPLDYATRVKMVQQLSKRLIILPLKDHRSDEVWSENLDSLIRNVCPIGTVLLYGGNDSFLDAYSGKFDSFSMPEFESIRATEARLAVAHEPLSSPNFRAGVIYAQANQYPKTVMCVDVVVVRGDKMLIAYKNGDPGWRFIGGHVEQTSLEEAARREVAEESGVSVGNLAYLGSFVVNDWRYAKDNSKIVSAVFSGDWLCGPIKAGDDVDQVEWVEYKKYPVEKLVHEHQWIFKLFAKAQGFEPFYMNR